MNSSIRVALAMKLFMITGLGSAKDLALEKGGAFYNTLEEFHKYWERIDIICPRIHRGSTSVRFEIEPLFGNVFLHISPWPLIFHPIWFLMKGFQIYREQKFDLMTVQEFPPFYNGIGAYFLWLMTKVPYVLEIHHITGYPRAAGIKEYAYKILTRWFIKFDALHAKQIRVVNQKQAPNFLLRAGLPESKIIYIPSIYIDLDIFRPIDLPRKYDLIFVGRLEKNKGINLFLDAVRILDCNAVIVGDGSLVEIIKSKIKAWNLKIDFHGWAKNSQEVAELINQSKLLVVPSYNEGGPRVVFEAMACGVPVLATPVGLVPDFNPPITLVTWNKREIPKKVLEILNNPAEYQRLRQRGLEVARRFERKMMIKNYADKLKGISYQQL